MTGEVIMTQGNRKSGWECIPSQSNLGVTLRLECGWLLAENTHQLKEWPWCGIMTLCEEAGGAKRTRCRQLLVRLPRRHSSDYLWNLSHVHFWQQMQSIARRYLCSTWTRQRAFTIMEELWSVNLQWCMLQVNKVFLITFNAVLGFAHPVSKCRIHQG